MPDTVRTLSALQALLADNVTGDISPQDVRDFLVSIYNVTDGLAARATALESRAAALESRATALETRATAIETAATNLAARVTTLEGGFPGTPGAKWGAYTAGWPPPASTPSIHSTGMDLLSAAVALNPKILHWYSQAGGWNGADNSSSYNWAGIVSNISACLTATIAPLVTWEFLGTFEQGFIRDRLAIQDFPLLAFTTTPQFGTLNAAVSSTNTTLTDTRAAWVTNQWAGQIVKANGKAMLVISNTATVMTGTAWTGGGNPGGTVAWTIRPTGLTLQAKPISDSGTGVTTTNTTLVDSDPTAGGHTRTQQAWGTNEFLGATVTCNGKTMVVTSNTATTLTGTGWSGGGNPGNAHSYRVGPNSTISGSEWETLQDYIDSWAVGCAALIATYGTSPVYLRIFHEFNLAYSTDGIGYPWGLFDTYNDGLYKTPGNTSARLVAAWIYIVGRFTAAGATNVRWVWNPGGDMGPNPIVTGSYPGDQYVDFLGADIYNTSPAGTVATDFNILKGTTLGGTATSGAKRMIFGEVGVAATANGGTTAPLTYINTDLHNMITAGAARIEAIVWWNSPQYAITDEDSEATAITAVTTTNTTLTDPRGWWGAGEFVGAVVTCNGKTMTVTSNTATTLTGTSGWSAGGNPGNAHAWSLKMPALCAAIAPMLVP